MATDWRLEVVVADGPDNIDDFIFEIEGSGALGTDVTISVSSVEREDD